MSQSQEILRLLRSGHWWTTREILQEVPSVVHSRIAELRKQGHEIIHERTGPGAAGSRYRLVLTEGERLEGKPVVSSSVSTRLLVEGGRDMVAVQPFGDRAAEPPGRIERSAPSCPSSTSRPVSSVSVPIPVESPLPACSPEQLSLEAA